MTRFLFLIQIFLMGCNSSAEDTHVSRLSKVECTREEGSKELYPLVSFGGYVLYSPYSSDELRLDKFFELANSKNYYLIDKDSEEMVMFKFTSGEDGAISSDTLTYIERMPIGEVSKNSPLYDANIFGGGKNVVYESDSYQEFAVVEYGTENRTLEVFSKSSEKGRFLSISFFPSPGCSNIKIVLERDGSKKTILGGVVRGNP